eukprot:comp23101_c0_seq3/m.37131 comp23101_c0_seq3/g.37131  ORF comp23101_c0_seq3/g.37131 comp23101_c0_seq3/m.37131 type:complete len:244 (-) comp23101_c0_seq3:443-1174(-)
MRASPEPYPSYLPETFDLVTEAPQFVSEYRRRASQGLDNSWIVKPWNMARSMRHVITTSLPRIIRLRESGPVVAQKYLHDPVLYEGNRKFDLRFMVLVQSVQPLRLYVHKVFLLRVANTEFALDHFDKYEKHFTVMNYRPGAQLTEISCADFEKGFDKLYKDQSHSWEQARDSINEAIGQLFEREWCPRFWRSTSPPTAPVCAVPRMTFSTTSLTRFSLAVPKTSTRSGRHMRGGVLKKRSTA